MPTTSVLDRCVDGAALAPLTSEQRRELALLARAAFRRLCEAGALGEAADFDDWRREQTMMCCERPGLRQSRQEDYQLIRAHFLRLVGQDSMADRAVSRGVSEPRRVAEYKLDAECQAARDVIDAPRAYVESIARARYHGARIEELGEKQLWVLVFDLRRNAQRRRKRGAAGAGELGSGGAQVIGRAPRARRDA
jgi:hypothetical protein